MDRLTETMASMGLSSDHIETSLRSTRAQHATASELLGDSSPLLHHQHESSTKQSPDICQRKANMLDLAVEVLEQVVSLVGPQEVIALRSMCKKLEEAATNSFIDHFVRCRRHAITVRSLKALIEVTAHPYFGKFVDKLVLDTTFPFREIGDELLVVVDEPLTHDDFYSFVYKALSALKVHGKPTILGLTDRNPASFGMEELLSRPTVHHFPQERDGVLSVLRHIAERDGVNLKIGGFDLELVGTQRPHLMGLDALAFASGVGQYVARVSTLTSFSMKVAMPPDSSDVGIVCDFKRETLMMSGINMWHGPRSIFFGLFCQTYWPWALRLKDMTLVECHIGGFYESIVFDFCLHMCLATLETIKLSSITIESELRWSVVLQWLARARRLKRFELSTLTRNIDRIVNSVPCRASIQYIDEWCGSGDEISAELLDLSAIVRADEDAWESIGIGEPRKWAVYTNGRNKQLGKVTEPMLFSADADLDVLP